jgi:hypothetical protein
VGYLIIPDPYKKYSLIIKVVNAMPLAEIVFLVLWTTPCSVQSAGADRAVPIAHPGPLMYVHLIGQFYASDREG